MSVILAMCCHDTVENKRTELTQRTLHSIQKTVNLDKHRLIVVDNNSCEATKLVLAAMQNLMPFEVITCDENIGTAKAINLAWAKRKPEEHCGKIDNDMVIHSIDWLDELEEAMDRMPNHIGQAGLKRVDLAESPDYPDDHFYKSYLMMLPHEPGQRWIVGENCRHIMGSALIHNWRLIDKVKGLWQPGTYGFDDSIMSLRSSLCGYINIFLPHILVSHIDPGGTEYTEYKAKYAGEQMEAFNKAKQDLINGTMPLDCGLE